MPQRHPPVCIPLNGKNPVSPVVFGDYSGTPLNEANQTQVGSIMPMFEYREYIDIPPVNKTPIPPAIDTRDVKQKQQPITKENAPAAFASQQRASQRAAAESGSA